MRTKKIPLLLAIAALGLASCGGGGDSSELTAESEEASTSEILDDSTSTEESSSDEEEAGWPTDEIAEALTSIVGYTGDIAIPTPSETLTEGHTFTIDTSLAWNGTTDRIIAITATGEFDGDAYIDEAVATGDWLEPSLAVSGCEFAHSTDEALQIVVYDYDSDADTTLIYISVNSWDYYAVWPETTLDGWMDDLAGSGATALPTVSDDIIQIAVLGDYTETDYGDYFTIEVYTATDFSADYIAALKAAGFITIAAGSSAYYGDPNLDYVVYVEDSYFSEYGCIVIEVYATTVVFYVEEEAATFDYLASYYISYLSNGYVTGSLPSFATLGYDLASMSAGYLSAYQQYVMYIWLWEFDDEGNTVDLTSAYTALLNESDDWIYLSDYGVYLASTGYAVVYVYGPSSAGCSLYAVVQFGNYTNYLPAGE